MKTRKARGQSVDDDVEASRAPLLDHLIELRNRLIWCLVAIAAAAGISFGFAGQIYNVLLVPFEQASRVANANAADPVQLELIYTGPMEFFFVKLKIALFGGLLLAFPILAWHTYRFIAPGLYRHERMTALPFMLAAPVMFGIGASFVHFVMMPLVMQFALGQQQIGEGTARIELLPRVSEYLSLVMALIIAFGFSFQLPVILTLLGNTGMVSSSLLRNGRKYALLLILIFAAVFTPPDIASQIMLGAPVYLLYEISIWLVVLAEKARAKRDREADGASPSPP